MHINNFQSLSAELSNVILPGIHALKHALRFGAEIVLSLSPDKAKLVELAEDLAPDTVDFIKLKVQEVELGQYQSLIKDAHRTGVISIAKKPRVKLKQVLESKKPLILIEDCRNLKNLGAVIRVSAGADIGGVLSLSDQVDIWHPNVLVGSAGLNFAVPCINITEDDLSLIKQYRELLALDPDTGKERDDLGHPGLPFSEVNLRRMNDSGSPEDSPTAKPPVYIFGTERGGISQQLLSLSDERIRIPMKPGVSSLNLATSVAIVVYKAID